MPSQPNLNLKNNVKAQFYKIVDFVMRNGKKCNSFAHYCESRSGVIKRHRWGRRGEKERGKEEDGRERESWEGEKGREIFLKIFIFNKINQNQI